MIFFGLIGENDLCISYRNEIFFNLNSLYVANVIFLWHLVYSGDMA